MSTTSADADLIRRVRTGDDGAFAALYAAHAPAARRFARSLARSAADAEDLVADAFARVLKVLRQGRGPSDGFLDYLLTTIRNRHIDLGRSERTTPASDRPWLFEEAAEPLDLETAIDELDSGAAVGAYTTLPERWQRVLWHTEVEGRTVAEVAQLLGTRPGSVSALLYRAREGLRLAYLEQLRDSTPPDPECQWVQDRLPQHLRGKLSRRAAARAVEHLATCETCAAVAARMEETNDKFAVVFLPAVVVGGAAVYAAGSGGGSGNGGPGEGTPGDSASVNGPSAGGTPSSASPAASARTLARGARWHRLTSGWAAATAATGAAAVVLAAAAVAFWPDGDAGGPAPGSPTSPAAVDRVPAPTLGAAGDSRLPAWRLPDPEPVETPSLPPVAVPVEPEDRPARAVTDPPPTVVRPVAPSATAITACDSYGRLVLPTTTGVRYELVRGDGRSGPWTVVARERAGYVIAASAPTTFEGDLGTHHTCPSLTGVTRTAAGSGWDIQASLDARGAGPYPVAVELRFDDTVYVGAGTGTGWSCWATDGTSRIVLDGTGEYQLQPGAQWVRCEATYDGTALAPVTVAVNLSASAPSGVAEAFRGTTATGSMGF